MCPATIAQIHCLAQIIMFAMVVRRWVCILSPHSCVFTPHSCIFTWAGRRAGDYFIRNIDLCWLLLIIIVIIIVILLMVIVVIIFIIVVIIVILINIAVIVPLSFTATHIITVIGLIITMLTVIVAMALLVIMIVVIIIIIIVIVHSCGKARKGLTEIIATSVNIPASYIDVL